MGWMDLNYFFLALGSHHRGYFYAVHMAKVGLTIVIMAVIERQLR